LLRRLAVSVLLSSVLLLAWGAAGAATPQTAAFRVTLSGTLTKDWAITRTVEGECDEITRTAGHWRMTLATRRASRVVVLGPSRAGHPLRFSPGTVRSIAGTAAQGGWREVEIRGPACERSVLHADCAGRRASFRNASARFWSPRRGRLRLGRLNGASAARSFVGACPEQPADIRSIRTELTLADAPISAADAFDRSVARFYIGGNTTQETTLEGEWDGKVVERVRWTLTFTRLG
jgi:hypothetical protein